MLSSSAEGPTGPGRGRGTDHSAQLEDLSAYVLDALPPGERQVVRVHVESCPLCQKELVALAALPGMLNRVRPDPAATLPPAPLPPVLRERLVNQVLVARDGQRRRRRIATAVGGVLTVAAVAVGLSTIGPLGPGSQTGSVTQALAYRPVTWVQPAGGRQASAAVTDHSWGTQLDIQATGWPMGEVSNIAVLTADGTLQQLGSWAGTGATMLHCSATTWSSSASLREVQISDPAGHLIAQLPMT